MIKITISMIFKRMLINLALFLRMQTQQTFQAMCAAGYACVCVRARAYHSNAVILFPSSFRSCKPQLLHANFLKNYDFTS